MKMKHVAFSRLLRQQTAIVQELGLYLSDGQYAPHARDFVLLEDISARAGDVQTLCHHLSNDFWRRRKE
jgi:hypothetical protein